MSGQKGVALVAVLWIVAALALLVGGMAAMSRAEVQRAQTHQAVGQVTVLGDAAIQLAVLDWKVTPPQPVRRVQTQYQVEGVPVVVRITPASGYISLNGAPESLLHDLFRYGADVDEVRATALAQSVIDWRDTDETPLPQGAEAPAYVAAGLPWRPRNGRFIAVEDLLQVIGMDLDVFDRIRSLVTVWSSAGGVDPRSAPEDVIAILAAGNLDQARRIVQGLDAGDPTIDMTTLNQAHLGASGSSILHIEAIVPVDEHRSAVRARWVGLAPNPEGAPWKTLSAERVYFIQGRVE